MKSIVFSAKGSGLASAMMIAGVMAIVALGVASLIQNLNKSSTFYDSAHEYDDLMKKVQLNLYNNTQCPLALRDATGNPKTIAFTGTTTPVDGIYSSNPGTGAASVLVKSGTAYNPHLSIKSLSVSQVAGSPVNTETIMGLTYKSYLVNVTVSVTTDGRDLPSKSIQLKVFTNPANANRIEKCSSVTADNQSCTAVGGYFDSTSGQCVMPICDAAHADIPCTQSCTPQTYSWVFKSLSTSASQKPLCVCNQSCTSSSGTCPPAPISVNTAWARNVCGYYTVGRNQVYRCSVQATPLSTITVQCSADGQHVAYKVQPTGSFAAYPWGYGYGASTVPTFNAAPATIYASGARSQNSYFSDFTVGTAGAHSSWLAFYQYAVYYVYYYYATSGYDGGHTMTFWNLGNQVPPATCPAGTVVQTNANGCCPTGSTYSPTGYVHYIWRTGRNAGWTFVGPTAGCYAQPTTNYFTTWKGALVAKVVNYTLGYTGPVTISW